MKGLGWMILIGGGLLGVATLLHPVVINPWSVLKVVPKTVQAFWVWDHFVMLAAVSIWLLSLVSVKSALNLPDSLSTVANSLFIGSLTIWVLILTMELGVIPSLGKEVIANSTPYLKTLWSVIFSFGLLSGYSAMFLAYIGILFLASEFKEVSRFSRLRSTGMLSGGIGAIGILLTLFKIEWGIAILIITTLPPFLWTLILGVLLIRTPHPRS